jgi:hypothetical protein
MNGLQAVADVTERRQSTGVEQLALIAVPWHFSERSGDAVEVDQVGHTGLNLR